MTKRENILYALKCRALDNPSTCNECLYYIAKWYCCDARSIMKDVLSLLEEQENGLEPKISRQEDGYLWYYCGKCGYEIDPSYENYCSICGTKIKLKEEENESL